MLNLEWEIITGPGGKVQWKPKNGPDIFMLTSDLALVEDETYRAFSEKYASDIQALETDFAAVWYKLTTADMGPSSRCIGSMVPKAQPFQNDLPATPNSLPDYKPIRASIEKLLQDEKNSDAFINLAYQCASTYRATDHAGGCNGARIRFPPESDWPQNAGTADALQTLKAVKSKFPEVSYSDLIVLAGLTALEKENSSLELPFCGGRVDTDKASISKDLSPRIYKDALVTILDDLLVKGLTKAEGVALASRKSVGTQYYKNLLAKNGAFDKYELALLDDAELKTAVELFSTDAAQLAATFQSAWTKLMTADRFAGPNANACAGVSTVTTKRMCPAKDDCMALFGLVSGVALEGKLFGLCMKYCTPYLLVSAFNRLGFKCSSNNACRA
jgi:catalase-peroxidase